MIDPISFGVGAALLAAGYLAGRIQRRPKAPSLLVPMCGCGHGLNDHDPQTGVCHGETARDKYNKHGEDIGEEWVACTCRRYVGPEHIADVWAPPMIGGTETP